MILIYDAGLIFLNISVLGAGASNDGFQRIITITGNMGDTHFA
jgi:hypothetical protein